VIGKTLAHYRITEKIGAGGMGEVYRATDTKLGRDVALKMLPAAFAQDPERMARFQREAQVLASLNHPNIGGIYGLEKEGETFALALELVEGPTLDDRIRSGPMPPSEALPIALQITEAMESAHGSGIVHRDLKPANVKLTPQGNVKVLDFGLAKALEADSRSPSGAALDSPTVSSALTSPVITGALTGANVILGTAAYMSPEQARGASVDKRTDIWSFGVVLFEMLAGRRPFAGDTVSDVLASVLKVEPDWDELPAPTPRALRRLLRRCLEKDPNGRLHDIADARLEIAEALAAPEEAPADAGAGARGGRVVGIAGLAVGAAAVLVSVWAPWRTAAPPPSDSAPGPVVRFSLPLNNDADIIDDALDVPLVNVSPDGSRIAFLAARDDTARLWMRDLASGEETVLFTGNAGVPFFERGGNRIGYMTRSTLELVRSGDRSGTVVADLGNVRGATWAEDGRIIYTPVTDGGLLRIDPRTGLVDTLTTLTEGGNVRSHRWPAMLPDDRGVLYTASAEDILSFDDAAIFVLDLRTMESRRLATGSAPRYARSGHLLWSRGGTLLAAPFDLESLQITGQTVAVIHDLATRPASGGAHFGVSDGGTLVYLPGPPDQAWSTLEWVDHEGNREPIETPRRLYQGIRVSPDGTKLAVSIDNANANIWTWDLDRSDLSRVSLVGSNNSPAWTSEGRSVLFSSARGGRIAIYGQGIDGSEAEQLTPGHVIEVEPDVSPDGTWLVYGAVEPARNGFDIYVRRLDLDEDDGVPLVSTDAREGAPRISPDGKWLAYLSDTSGREEVYVRPFPEGHGQWKASNGGASDGAAWAPDGSALYWVSGDGDLMEASFRTDPTVRIGRPRRLFGDPRYDDNFDVGPDGRFLMIRNEPAMWQPDRVEVVVNWFQELERLAPADATP